ncbi:ATP-binding cassette domain-containing protein [bacterium]|nr:ATP-binding cassette domain-containing protein [bacterium]
MIKLENVSKSFDNSDNFAVRDVSFTVQKGETVVLLGSSGCGKTTTLKMINRLVEPTGGRIEIDGHDNREYDPVHLRRTIGYVFQGLGLFPHLTIEENVTIVLRLQGESRETRKNRATELLEMVELDPNQYRDRHPHELSGGQQQRIGVARALAADPDYLLMDEPFGALDAITRDTMQQEILQLNERLHKTIIFVTHDLFEAITIADRIAVMHQGHLEQIGAKEDILSNPATKYVRELFEKPEKQLQMLQEGKQQ